MTEAELEFLRAQFGRVFDQLRDIRAEQRRLSENQMLMNREINVMHQGINGLRDHLELMIRTEIGGLFAHLETRLEQRIDDALNSKRGDQT